MMTDEEIITCLKENRKKGVSFNFMPKDVRIWCELHKDDPIFNVYFSDGWKNVRTGITCQYSGIYTLSDDYEPKPEFKPHWEEFDIDDKGYFVDKLIYTEKYKWFSWERFLLMHDEKYNCFGGWLYEGRDSFFWNTAPQLLCGDLLCDCLRSERKQYEKTPPIPSKIRFWRYAE